MPSSCPWKTTEEPFTSSTAKPSPVQSHPTAAGSRQPPGDVFDKQMYLTFCVQGARRHGCAAARTGVFAFIRSLAPGRCGQTLPTAEESQGQGSHMASHVLFRPRAYACPAPRVQPVPGTPGYPAVPAAAVPGQQAGLGVSTTWSCCHIPPHCVAGGITTPLSPDSAGHGGDPDGPVYPGTVTVVWRGWGSSLEFWGASLQAQLS